MDEVLNALTKEVKEKDKKEISFDEMKKVINKQEKFTLDLCNNCIFLK